MYAELRANTNAANLLIEVAASRILPSPTGRRSQGRSAWSANQVTQYRRHCSPGEKENQVRLIKMFSLAAMAAIAAMAYVGVSSASATFDTELCTEGSAELKCPAGKRAESVHFVSTNFGVTLSAELLTDFGNVKCDVLFSSLSVLALGKPQVIHGHFTYPHCERNENLCEVKQVSADALIEVLKTAANLGTVTGSGEVLVKCGAFIHCTYNGVKLEGHALGASGANPGEVTLHEQTVQKVGGPLCPNTAKLDILMRSLTNLWIRS